MQKATARRRLLHDDWELTCRSWEPPRRLGFSEQEWRPAQVPGHVHTDLVRHGIISDPFEAMFELGCQWVDDEFWSYRTSFEFVGDVSRPRRALLFEGLDTVCDVFLNDERIATHDNMFVPLEVDVSERLLDGKNRLRIDFEPATSIGRERRRTYFEKNGIATSVKNFDERAFVRKAQYMFGWDWGPRLVSAGLWKPVALLEFQSRILDVHVEQEHLEAGEVRIALCARIDGPGEVLHHIEGLESPLRDGETLRIAEPRLWWPVGLGKQSLYQVTTILSEGGRELDRVVTRFGVRRVRLIRTPDAHGESYEFEINGKRIWAMGANWIPDHSLPSEVTAERVRSQLTRARDMNMNMLRIWGGGYYETDEFYAQCDDLGIMVWQDFPFACSYYPDDESAHQQLRVEASANVTRLRNHPSLVLWCGNNENTTMFESKWGGAEHQPSRFFGAALYDAVIPEVLARLDPSRPYVNSSPSGGNPSNSGGVGDQHTWDVWHGRGDWKYYADSRARFSSEFGFASAPSERVWSRVLPANLSPASARPDHPIARWHDKTAKGFGVFRDFVELHYPVADSLDEWTYFSQLNQRDALRFAIEHFRRSEFCRGALIWQFNDCWPVQSWSVIDYAGIAKAAARELRRLYAPLMASLEIDAKFVRFWGILDNGFESYTGPARLQVHSLLDGSVIDEWQIDAEISPGERKVLLDVDLSKFEREVTVVTATLGNTSTTRLLVEPKDARLPLVPIEVQDLGHALRVTSVTPVIDLHLWDQGGSWTLLDDFTTLPGGGSTTLRTEGRVSALVARSLAGIHALIERR